MESYGFGYSFGFQFGLLVKSRRGQEGLTQQQLAVQAFGDERYKARISDLEKGKIDNPQQKTIDLLKVALNISDELISGIYQEVREEQQRKLPSELREAIVEAFEIEEKNASQADLEKLIRYASKQYRKVKYGFELLSNYDSRLENVLADVERLVNEAKFREADTTLRTAIEMYLGVDGANTQRVKSELTVERLRIALLARRFSKALDIAEQAASNLSDDRKELKAQFLDQCATVFSAYYSKKESKSRFVAVEFWRKTLKYWPQDNYPIKWANSQFKIGVELVQIGDSHLVDGGHALELAADVYKAKDRVDDATVSDFFLLRSFLKKPIAANGSNVGWELLSDIANTIQERVALETGDVLASALVDREIGDHYFLMARLSSSRSDQDEFGERAIKQYSLLTNVTYREADHSIFAETHLRTGEVYEFLMHDAPRPEDADFYNALLHYSKALDFAGEHPYRTRHVHSEATQAISRLKERMSTIKGSR